MVDIVVISYNQASYIKQCLDSILHQTNSSWNLYVVDDCSPDDSVKVFDNWLAENKVQAYKKFNPKNLGLCKTLNEIIPDLQADFVKILAADDYLEPDYLDLVLSAFKEDNDAALAHANARYVFENGQTAPVQEKLLHNYKIPSGKIKPQLFEKNIIGALTAIMKTSVLKKIGGFNEQVLIEDYDMWLRIAIQDLSILYVDKVLANYRLHGANISQKKKDLIDLEAIMSKIKYDAKGEFRKIVHFDLLDIYNRFGSDKSKLQMLNDVVMKEYEAYKGKSNLLTYFITNRIPYSFFRFFKFFVQ